MGIDQEFYDVYKRPQLIQKNIGHATYNHLIQTYANERRNDNSKESKDYIKNLASEFELRKDVQLVLRQFNANALQKKVLFIV